MLFRIVFEYSVRIRGQGVKIRLWFYQQWNLRLKLVQKTCLLHLYMLIKGHHRSVNPFQITCRPRSRLKNPDGSRSPPVDFAFSGQSRSVIAQDNNQVSTSRQSLQEADGLVTQRWISRAVKLYKWFRSCPNRALTIVRYIDLNVPGRAMPVASWVGRAGKSQADNLFRPRPQSECQLSRARAYIVVFSKQRGVSV